MAVLCGSLAGADHEAPNGQEHGVQLHPRCRPVAGKDAPRSDQSESVDPHARPGVRRRCRQATVGGWSANPRKVTSGTLGKPFKPRSKSGYLSALRGFFCDLQEWGVIETLAPGSAALTDAWQERSWRRLGHRAGPAS